MGEFTRQRPEFIADQPVLKRPHPRRIQKRFGQMFVHLTIPFAQQRQCILAQPVRCTFWGRFASEPKIGANEWQDRSRRIAYRIKLSLDEAVAGMYLACLHQQLPTVHPLTVAPIKTDMGREGFVRYLIVCVADNAANRVYLFWVFSIITPPIPSVLL